MRNSALLAIALIAVTLPPAHLSAQDAVKRDTHEMHRLHKDPKADIGMLDDPKRDAYQKPHEVLTALNIKPGGEIVMIDFHKKELPFGPPLRMKIAREDLIEQMANNGFRLSQEHTFLPYQYFPVFAPR